MHTTNDSNINPTQQQLRIITDTRFPRYLTAGPGTGKTEILINKIIFLLENESYADIVSGAVKFAVITYTNKATDEMKGRLSGRIYGEWMKAAENKDKWQYLLEAGGVLEVSTIHSFCYTLLKKYGSAIGYRPDLEIKSYKQELNALVDMVLSRADEPLLGRIPAYRLRYIVRDIIRECHNHGMTPSMDYIKSHKSDDVLWTMLEAAIFRVCIEVHEELERKKQFSNALTLNDLISMAVKLLGNEHILERVSAEYKYLFIDEFQDTNRSQLDIVRILIGAGVNIFIIGDEKQSIYAFRGADIECSRQARQIISAYHSDDDFQVNENFRTDQALLMKINDAFNKPFTYKGKELYFPHIPLSKTAELQNIPAANENSFRTTYGEEIQDIVRNLTEEYLHGQKIKYEDIFILCRTNYEARQISNKLRRSGIPCTNMSEKDLDFWDIAEESEPFEDEVDICDIEDGQGMVSVLTIHKAKGLSLPIVIIANIDRSLVRKRAAPDYVIDRNDKTFALGNILGRLAPGKKYLHLLNEKMISRLEEEIRVLYVAMTRVKHILIMTNSMSQEELKRTRRDKNEISWSMWLK